MSTDFTGVTFAKQKVTPADDAIVRRAILPDGILTGCALSYSGSTLTMAAGQLMVCGRQIKHPSAQNWAVSDATSGYARLLLTIDLTRTASKETFDQVVDTIEYATSADGFSELEQADINSAGTKYQIAVCVVSLGTGGITGIVEELEKSEASAGKLFAVIGVTYPAGSTCTCTNGSKTLTAKDASGKALFVIPSAGTWTVKAVKGSQSKSKAVSITAEGQVETVTLMFELYLFTSGEGVVDDWTPLYGGYTNAAVTSEKMTLNSGEAFYYSSTVAVTSNNAIDLSGYSKLVVDVQTNKSATDNVYAWVGVSATKFKRGAESSTISISNSAAYTKISTTTRYEIEVDIADINTGYVFVASNGTNINTTAYNIWLE